MSTEDSTTQPSSLLSVHVSVFHGSTNTTPVETLPLSAMLQRIQDGLCQEYVAYLRQLRATQGKDAYDKAKKKSMGFTPAGVFAGRANAKLTTASGLVHFDFDHPPNLADARGRLIEDPWIAYTFVSPSGDGLKAAVWAEGIVDDRTYKHAWGTVLAYFERTYPDLAVANDKACKDIARLCYASFDPDLYSNPAPRKFDVPAYQPPEPKPKPAPQPKPASHSTPAPIPADRRERYAQQAIDTAVQMIQTGIPSTDTSLGTRHDSQLKAAKLLGGYVAGGVLSQAEAYAALSAAVASNTADFSVDMETIAYGMRYGEAEPITFDQLEAERLDWIENYHAGLLVSPPVSEAEGPTPQQTADTLLERLKTLADDAREDAIFEAMPGLVALGMVDWLKLKRQLKKAVPSVNLNDLGRARNELRRTAGSRPTLDFKTNKEGRPQPITSNIEAVFKHDPRWQGVLAFDELANDVMLLERPPYLLGAETWQPRALRDRDASETSIWLQRQYDLCVTTGAVAEVLEMYAGRSAFHVIRDYLAGLTWDNTPRLDTWLVTYCHAKDTAYTSAVGRSTLIAAVARVMEPGCKVDTVCILEGSQGTLKSTVWRTLASDPWFSDTLPPNLTDKDAAQCLRGKWIIELGELAAMRHNEKEVLKRFISAQADHYRPSYGRHAMSFPRMSVFVGSTNLQEIFDDETGNRRYWPVAVTGMCDIAALKRDRDQLWAEAFVAYRQGEAWHLTPELELAAIEEQEARLEADPWEDRIMTFVHRKGYTEVTTEELFRDALGFDRPDLWTKASRNRLGRILRQHRWLPSRVYITVVDTYGQEAAYQVRGFAKQQHVPF